MADYDELLAQIPIADIARRLGIDPDDAQDAVQQVLPGLVGGLEANAQDPAGAASLERALVQHGGAPRLRALEEIDTHDGEKIVGHVFGANTDQVAARLAGASPKANVTGEIIGKILPIVAPIVLGWLASRFLGGADSSPASGGGIEDVIGGALGGGSGGGGVGELLGGLLGGGSAGGSPAGGLDIGGLLGGLLGGGSR